MKNTGKEKFKDMAPQGATRLITTESPFTNSKLQGEDAMDRAENYTTVHTSFGRDKQSRSIR